MLQWWADFLDANLEKAVSTFDFAKTNNNMKLFTTLFSGVVIFCSWIEDEQYC